MATQHPGQSLNNLMFPGLSIPQPNSPELLPGSVLASGPRQPPRGCFLPQKELFLGEGVSGESGYVGQCVQGRLQPQVLACSPTLASPGTHHQLVSEARNPELEARHHI